MDKTINAALLGQILLRNNKVTDAQLQHALKLQQKDKKKRVLGELLISLGYIHESDMVFAIKEQMEIYKKMHARAD